MDEVEVLEVALKRRVYDLPNRWMDGAAANVEILLLTMELSLAINRQKMDRGEKPLSLPEMMTNIAEMTSTYVLQKEE